MDLNSRRTYRRKRYAEVSKKGQGMEGKRKREVEGNKYQMTRQAVIGEHVSNQNI